MSQRSYQFPFPATRGSLGGGHESPTHENLSDVSAAFVFGIGLAKLAGPWIILTMRRNTPFAWMENVCVFVFVCVRS